MDSKYVTNLDFVSFQVKNLEKSKKFYTEVLGFELAQSPNEKVAVVFKTGSGSVFAIRTPHLDLNSVEKLGWGISPWFGVDDIDSYYKNVSSKTKVIQELKETPFGKTFVVADPNGYLITIQQKESK